MLVSERSTRSCQGTAVPFEVNLEAEHRGDVEGEKSVGGHTSGGWEAKV